jgi:hypothetical protein
VAGKQTGETKKPAEEVIAVDLSVAVDVKTLENILGLHLGETGSQTKRNEIVDGQKAFPIDVDRSKYFHVYT